MSIYVWKVGEIALARLSRKVYAKVRVVKNEDGIFHDEKGISFLHQTSPFYSPMLQNKTMTAIGR